MDYVVQLVYLLAVSPVPFGSATAMTKNAAAVPFPASQVSGALVVSQLSRPTAGEVEGGR